MDERRADVGARFREARERRGLTLQALARATKIPLTALTAIERNDITRLPGGLYTRGHLRAYAAEVGLSPEASAREYLAQFETPGAEEPAEPIPAVPQNIDSETPLSYVRLVPGLIRERVADALGRVGPSRLRLVAALAFGVGLLAYGVVYLRRSVDVAPPASRATDAVPAEGVAGVPDREVPTAALATSERPALQLEVETQGTCWVSIRTDGRLAVYKLMYRGERALVGAEDTIVLHVGDAGAMTYRLNGAPGRPLGRTGDVVTVSITERTYKTFLAGAAVNSPAG